MKKQKLQIKKISLKLMPATGGAFTGMRCGTRDADGWAYCCIADYGCGWNQEITISIRG